MTDSFGRTTMAAALATAMTMPLAQRGRAPAIESIQQAELRADLFFLSSDAMRGRLTNTPTNLLAADWVRSRFERLGLEPGGHGGTFDHRYSLMTATLDEGNDAIVESGETAWKLGLLQDAKMEKIVRMVYQASWDVANAATRPTLLPVGTTRAPSANR